MTLERKLKYKILKFYTKLTDCRMVVWAIFLLCITVSIATVAVLPQALVHHTYQNVFIRSDESDIIDFYSLTDFTWHKGYVAGCYFQQDNTDELKVILHDAFLQNKICTISTSGIEISGTMWYSNICAVTCTNFELLQLVRGFYNGSIEK